MQHGSLLITFPFLKRDRRDQKIIVTLFRTERRTSADLFGAVYVAAGVLSDRAGAIFMIKT